LESYSEISTTYLGANNGMVIIQLIYSIVKLLALQ